GRGGVDPKVDLRDAADPAAGVVTPAHTDAAADARAARWPLWPAPPAAAGLDGAADPRGAERTQHAQSGERGRHVLHAPDVAGGRASESRRVSRAQCVAAARDAQLCRLRVCADAPPLDA